MKIKIEYSTTTFGVRVVCGTVTEVRDKCVVVTDDEGCTTYVRWACMLRLTHYAPYALNPCVVTGEYDCRSYIIQTIEEKLPMYPQAVTAPVPPTAPPPLPMSGPDRLAALEAALAAETDKQNREEIKAIKQQAIKADLEVLAATETLLRLISAVVEGDMPTQFAALAKHAKTLKAMAEQHGYKIVHTGDKTQATIVAI